MAIRVTLSANAGVSVELGGVRIWIDALHDTRVPGFSTLTVICSSGCGPKPPFSRRMPLCIRTVIQITMRRI